MDEDLLVQDTRLRIERGFKKIHHCDMNDLHWEAVIHLCMKVDMDPLIYTYEEIHPMIMPVLAQWIEGRKDAPLA